MWNGAYGYEYIPFTGLYHVGAREYDPRTARWLQRDPIDASSGDPNLYRYCTNDSLNAVDPDGLDPEWGKLFDIGIGFVPIVGSLWDIGKGIAEGDWTRVGMGAVGLVVDVATLGSSRVAVGAARAGVVGARMVRGAADCRALITAAKGTARAGIVRGGSHPTQIGKAGEQAVGITKPKTQIRSVSGSKKYRVPDKVTKTYVLEVKNVRRLSFTAQLKDYLAYCEGEGLQFILVVRRDTRLSKTLLELEKAGRITIRREL